MTALRAVISQIQDLDPLCRTVDESLEVLVLLAFASSLGGTEALHKAVVLKGGTILRLLLNGKNDRPPTKDLDASLIEDVSGLDELLEIDIATKCENLLQKDYDSSFEFSVEKMRGPAAGARQGQHSNTHVYRLMGSVDRAGGGRVQLNKTSFKFDVTTDEVVNADLLINTPSIPGLPSIALKCYAPLQSLAEKLRAMLQKRRYDEDNLANGGQPNEGNYPPRHVLDIERLHDLCLPHELNQLLPDLFRDKCKARDIPDWLLKEQYFEHELLSAQVRHQCQEHGRSFTSCMETYRKCYRVALSGTPRTRR